MMTPVEQEIFKVCIRDFSDKTNEILSNSLNHSVQLLFAEFGQFNSVGSIGIALMTLGLGTKYIEINILSIISIISLLFLIIYSNSYVKETIDIMSKDIGKTASLVEIKNNEFWQKVEEVATSQDFSIFSDYAKKQIKKDNAKIVTEMSLSCAGEIVNFSLFIGLFSGVFSVLYKYQELFSINCLLLLIIFISFLFSFVHWSTFITKKFSNFFIK